jgi:hypothetical protein
MARCVGAEGETGRAAIERRSRGEAFDTARIAELFS